MIKVWDLPTRIFHWVLVIAMVICLYTSYNLSTRYTFSFFGDHEFSTAGIVIHQYAGVIILGLLIFRIIWGLIGSETSRFANFIKGPKYILDYIKEAKSPTEGHNPLGALMVLALILLLLIQVTTGLFLEDNSYTYAKIPLLEGKLKDYLNIFTAIHTNGRAVLLWFIGLHITAVFAYLIVKRQNLIRTMITGTRDRSAAHTEKPESISADRPLIGLALMIIIIFLTFYILF